MDIENSIKKTGALIFRDVDGKKITSFQSGGKVNYLILPADEISLIKTVCALCDAQIPFKVIGNGTNVLISDNGYSGALISLKRLSEISCLNNTITAGAGASLNKVVITAVENGLSGLEFAEGIPASVGGAVAMNAGAYGAEIGSLVQSVNVLNGFNIKTLNCDDLRFRYRGSKILDNQILVTSATFLLKTGKKENIIKAMQGFSEKRAFSQPKGKSAGSVFIKNEGVSAGYYLDKLGFKGRKIGGAIVSEKHANFIINVGGATTSDFIALSNEMEKAVLYEYGIHLKKEIVIIGE